MKETPSRITLNIPLTVVEPLFTVLHNLRASQHSRLEMKAVQILKSEIYFELEKLMETEEEAEARKTDFMKMFNNERRRREKRKEELFARHEAE
jgi:hypothetical protein